MNTKPAVAASVSAVNLAVGYRRKAVLSGISFNISPGCIALITGPNGSGKTTLVKTVLALLPPVTGTLDVTGGRPGYVPQFNRIDEQLPLSLYDVVALGVPGRFGKVHTRDSHEQVLDRLAVVGLQGHEKLLFRNASGGQKQRTLIARALLGEVGMVIMDEPFSNLDRTGFDNVAALLNRLNKDKGLTIVIIDHAVNRESLNYTTILDVSQWQS